MLYGSFFGMYPNENPYSARVEKIHKLRTSKDPMGYFGILGLEPTPETVDDDKIREAFSKKIKQEPNNGKVDDLLSFCWSRFSIFSHRKIVIS